MQQIIDQKFEEERALYALRDTHVIGCVFEGAADGESALKECRDIKVHNCRFSLRYPLWHAKNFLISDSYMAISARAPIWYTATGTLRHCRIHAPKALRECEDTLIESSLIDSSEFGWKCRELTIRSSEIHSDYLLLDSRDVKIQNLRMSGKYSFQYVENLTLEGCTLDTKDAFWHCKNVTVTDSLIKGEYLGWFSEGLTLINCRIVGTQPLCYCKNLRLINCVMENTDLSFEYSQVDAVIQGEILSVKNPRSGRIVADRIGQVIFENAVMETDCQIEIKSKI